MFDWVLPPFVNAISKTAPNPQEAADLVTFTEEILNPF